MAPNPITHGMSMGVYFADTSIARCRRRGVDVGLQSLGFTPSGTENRRFGVLVGEGRGVTRDRTTDYGFS